MRKFVLLITSLLVIVPTLSSAYGQADFSAGPQFTFMEVAVGSHKIDTSSTIYSFNEENLLFNPSDLDSLDVTLGMYWQRNNTLAMGISLQAFDSSVVTEDRFFEFEDGSPILQEIGLDKTYVGFNAIITPFGAGERFGSQAWAPKTFVPYIRLGVGVLEWEYLESGDFVDYETLDIFFDSFYSDGSAIGFQAGVGFRVKISPRMDLFADYTHTTAEDDLDGVDFQGFGDLDLTSKSTSFGLTIKFF